MLQVLSHIDTKVLPTDVLHEMALDELIDDPWRDLHVVVHHSEVVDLLNICKLKVLALWFDFGNDRYAWASIVRSVKPHTDLDVLDEEAFILIVTHVEWEVLLYVGREQLQLEEGQVIFFDPHIQHGVKTKSIHDNACVIRVTVKKPSK